MIDPVEVGSLVLIAGFISVKRGGPPVMAFFPGRVKHVEHGTITAFCLMPGAGQYLALERSEGLSDHGPNWELWCHSEALCKSAVRHLNAEDARQWCAQT